MTREEIIAIEGINPEESKELIAFTDHLSEVFAIALIIIEYFEKKTIPTFDLKGYLVREAQWIKPLRQQDNAMAKFFQGVADKLKPAENDYSVRFMPIDADMRHYLEGYEQSELMGNAIQKARELLEKHFPKLPRPYKEIASLLKSGSAEANRTCLAIRRVMRVILAHDLKVSGETDPKKLIPANLDKVFLGLVTDFAKKMEPKTELAQKNMVNFIVQMNSSPE